jgi:hypothetical protein
MEPLVKPKRRESDDKPTRAKFAALGTRVMAVSKEELDARDKQWRAERKRKTPRK